MERTSDFEKLLFLYKTEGKGISLEQFCINNGVNYRVFDKWYRNRHEGIVPVQVIGAPGQENDTTSPLEHETGDSIAYFSNGMYVRHKQNYTWILIRKSISTSSPKILICGEDRRLRR